VTSIVSIDGRKLRASLVEFLERSWKGSSTIGVMLERGLYPWLLSIETVTTFERIDAG
jgi:hypothetical protein